MQPASHIVHRADRCGEDMRGAIMRRDVLLAVVDLALTALDIGFLGGQSLLAIVSLRYPRQQVAFAR